MGQRRQEKWSGESSEEENRSTFIHLCCPTDKARRTALLLVLATDCPAVPVDQLSTVLSPQDPQLEGRGQSHPLGCVPQGRPRLPNDRKQHLGGSQEPMEDWESHKVP